MNELKRGPIQSSRFWLIDLREIGSGRDYGSKYFNLICINRLSFYGIVVFDVVLEAYPCSISITSVWICSITLSLYLGVQCCVPKFLISPVRDACMF